MIRIPDHITEAEVLALIENDMGSLPAERRDIVREAVAAVPALAQLVGESRLDCTTIVSMSRVSAPSNLRARVIEELKRPMPRPDVIREPAGGEIPVSSMIVSHQSKWERFIETVPVRKYAVAASLILAAGLSVMLIRNAARTLERPAPGPIVLADPRSSDPAILDPLPREIDDSDSAIALNPPRPDDLPVPPLNHDGPSTIVNDAPIVVAADKPAPPPGGMPVAQAIELARAGRLIIRVHAADEAGAKSDIESIAAHSAKELRWRPLEAWELTEVTLALRGVPRPPAPFASSKPVGPKDPPKDGTPVKPAPVVEPTGNAADVADALRQANAHPLYNVELDETQRDLAALLEQLAADTTRTVEFVALEKALPTTPSTDPAAVLWWTRPPAGWTRRISVPIVLESQR